LDFSSSGTTNYDFNTVPAIPTLNNPVNGTNFTVTWAILNYSYFDPEADNVNCFFYTGTSATTLKLNASGVNCSNFNLSGIPDGTWYHLAMATDTFLNSSNSTISWFIIDTSAPIITNLQNLSITTDSVIINWTSDELANWTLNYGLTHNLGSLFYNSTKLAGNRQWQLISLAAESIYYYNLTTCDYFGHCATIGDYNFTTATATPPYSSGGGGGGSTIEEPELPLNESTAVVQEPTYVQSWNGTIRLIPEIYSIDDLPTKATYFSISFGEKEYVREFKTDKTIASCDFTGQVSCLKATNTTVKISSTFTENELFATHGGDITIVYADGTRTNSNISITNLNLNFSVLGVGLIFIIGAAILIKKFVLS
jgi:hypothetical protein